MFTKILCSLSLYYFLVLLKSLSVIVTLSEADFTNYRNDFKHTTEYRNKIAKEVIENGWAILPSVLDISLIDRLRRAEFPPLLKTRMEASGPDRGPGRYYLTPPFEKGWADERLIAQPDILDVVSKVVGKDAVLCQIGVDTPLGRGESEFQEIHRDCGPLFEEDDYEEPPSYQLAVNFPLLDVLPAKRGTFKDLGPLEIHKGSHRTTVKEGIDLIKNREVELEPVYMKAGDVLIRDVRVLHRGTPNFGPNPRPVGVIGYSRKWLRRPEVGIRVTKEYLQRASPTVQSLLRFENVVDEIEKYDGLEKYGADKLQETSGGSFSTEP